MYMYTCIPAKYGKGTVCIGNRMDLRAIKE